MSARVEAVLLDMGGVLLPEVSAYEAAARQPDLCATLRARGIDAPDAFIRDCGARLREAYRKLEPTCEQPDCDAVLDDVDPGVRRLLLRAFRSVTNVRPYPHVREIIAALARRYRLGIVSNTILPGDHHARTLRRAGILEHFDAALWSANFGRRKPDPAMIHHVLAQLRVPPRSALFVGDKLRTDVAAAHNAGVRAVHLRTRHTERRQGPRPHFTIRDLRELPLLLRGL